MNSADSTGMDKAADSGSEGDAQINKAADRGEDDAQIDKAAGRGEDDAQIDKAADRGEDDAQIDKAADRGEDDAQINKAADRGEGDAQIDKAADRGEDDAQINKAAGRGEGDAQIDAADRGDDDAQIGKADVQIDVADRGDATKLVSDERTDAVSERDINVDDCTGLFARSLARHRGEDIFNASTDPMINLTRGQRGEYCDPDVQHYQTGDYIRHGDNKIILIVFAIFSCLLTVGALVVFVFAYSRTDDVTATFITVGYVSVVALTYAAYAIFEEYYLMRPHAKQD